MQYKPRSHLSTIVATVGSLVNFYQIRQQVIKHAIYFSRSNNPNIVKSATVCVGLVYLVGLFGVWHLPTLFIEIGLRTSLGMSQGVVSWLNPAHKVYPIIHKINSENLI